MITIQLKTTTALWIHKANRLMIDLLLNKFKNPTKGMKEGLEFTTKLNSSKSNKAGELKLNLKDPNLPIAKEFILNNINLISKVRTTQPQDIKTLFSEDELKLLSTKNKLYKKDLI